MIDVQLLRDNPDVVKDAVAKKGYDINVDELVELDKERRSLQQELDSVRSSQKSISERIASEGGIPDQELIKAAKEIKSEVSDKEATYREVNDKFNQLFRVIPNLPEEDVPLGGEEDSVEIKKWGEAVAKEGVDHLTFATERDWVDFERGAKVAGAKFYYLKNDLALLENAITQYGLSLLMKKGFNFMTVPNMVNSRIATGTGFAPRTSDQSDEYYIEGEDLSLIATAEIPLTGYHADEILDEKDLPLFYAGLSPCYRKEAGTYGKHTRGLFRVHQFNKLEMYAYSLPEDSKKIHEQLLAIEEEIWQSMGIPYRVVLIAAGDLGAPASKKFDLEYFSPIDDTYRELTSCSNCTDYQARNLDIRVRRSSGEIETAHTLNGTAVSLARSLVAVIENYQTDDGRLEIPEVLQPYMQGRKFI